MAPDRTASEQDRCAPERTRPTTSSKSHGAPTVSTVVDSLGAQIYSYPLITTSHDGNALYTIKGRDLVRIGGLR